MGIVLPFPQTVLQPCGLSSADHAAALAASNSAAGWCLQLVEEQDGDWISLEPPAGPHRSGFAVLRTGEGFVIQRRWDGAAWTFRTVRDAIGFALLGVAR